jgi:hypothetical protein
MEYGGYIPRDSYFATYQSLGARGDEEEDKPPGVFMTILSWSAFIAAGVVFFGGKK